MRPPQHDETAALLGHLGGVRTCGVQWLARCPGHDDVRPSLSVGEGRIGVVLRCHAGCPASAILDAVGLTFSDLFFDRRNRS